MPAHFPIQQDQGAVHLPDGMDTGSLDSRFQFRKKVYSVDIAEVKQGHRKQKVSMLFSIKFRLS